MDLATYADGIRFRFMHPHTLRPKGYGRVSRLLDRIGVHPEVINTCLPPTDPTAVRALTELCRVPRMSTFAIGAIINRAVSQLPAGQMFVNVGVWNGFTFLSGLANNQAARCVGIDNFSRFGGPRAQFAKRFERSRSPNHHFFDMDYAEYFARVHDGLIGFYMYDGRHTYAEQMAGLVVAEKFFADRCLILIDDTNLEPSRRATLDFVRASTTSYRVLFDRTTAGNAHPTFWNGLILLQRTTDRD
jgi:hypothetical protein